MTLKKLIETVHKFGLWRSENSYETKCEYFKNCYYIYNIYLEDQENILHDTIIIECDTSGKLGKFYSVDISQINKLMFHNYPYLFDPYFYNYYLIE